MKRCLSKTVFVIAFAAISSFTFLVSSAEGSTVTDLTDYASFFRIEKGVEYLVEETPEKLTLEQVVSKPFADRWRVYTKKRINFYHQPRAVWIKFTLENRSNAEREWVLAIDWPLLERIDYYQINDENLSRVKYYFAGMGIGTDRLFQDPGYVFPLKVYRGKQSTILLRITTENSFIVPLAVWEADDFQKHQYNTGVFIGFLFGVLIVMMFYNFSLGFFTMDRSYIIYSVYLLLIILYELAVTGIGALYIWGDYYWFRARSYQFFASLSFLGATAFFRYFLDLKNSRPHINWLNLACIFCWVLISVLSAFHSSRGISAGIVAMGFIISILGIYISLYLIYHGNVSARYLFFAWSIVIVGTNMLLLSLMGAFDRNWFADNGQHIGFMIETVLLSIALADKIKRERMRREAAQTEVIELNERVSRERREKIEAQEQVIDIQIKANTELEMRVHERTNELNVAMHNLEKANTELAELSITDPLTKISNRRYFDQNIKREFERSINTAEPLALIMIDIDHFKNINDKYGHLEGDRCLKMVAEVIRNSAARTTDMVARFGGEEFAVLLPNINLPQAMVIAERIRSGVESIQFVHRGVHVVITISAGVVSRGIASGSAIEDFIADADLALYKAKVSGRNRVLPATGV